MSINQISQLQNILQGDVLTDTANLLAYSTDASVYQQRPLAIARPKHHQDCINLVQFAAANSLSLIPRAGGTSLAGQVVGESIVVDTSRYLTGIKALNIENKTAKVEAGVIAGELNRQLSIHGLKFAPDPSTFNRATIAGLIGNNAWGSHCPQYGSTREHILSCNAILSNGHSAEFSTFHHNETVDNTELNSTQTKLFTALIDLLSQHQELILNTYPHAVPCNAGYALHTLCRQIKTDNSINLSALLCGSEGTLALISEATVNLTPTPKHSVLVCCHFHLLDEALQSVVIANTLRAHAVELLDDVILKLTAHNRQLRMHRHWIKENPKAVLLVEFNGDDKTALSDQAHVLINALGKNGLGYAFPILTDTQSHAAWEIRRAGLGLLMGMKNPRKPVTLIEDSAVPPSALPAFVQDIKRYLAHIKVDCVYYGSVSMGLIHLRPLLNLDDATDRQHMHDILDTTSDLLLKYRGTLSAKHGDGRLRGGYLKKMLGAEVYEINRRIKTLFDPNNLFNPHTLFDPLPLTQDLRHGVHSATPITTYFNWDSDAKGTRQTLYSVAMQCNGAGVCRKLPPQGIMCPSYMATREEMHSTRGRANIYRQLLQSKPFVEAITDETLHNALDLCLACKGCASECPANVDMARMKAEHLQHYFLTHGVPLRHRIINRLESIYQVCRYFPRLSNYVMNTRALKRLLGFSAQRKFPLIPAKTLTARTVNQTMQHNNTLLPNVVLLNNLFSEYFDANIAEAAITVINKAGFNVRVSPCFTSLRTAISQGQLIDAKDRLQILLRWIRHNSDENTYFVGLEPSELLTLRDDALALADNVEIKKQLDSLQSRCLLFEEFVVEFSDDFNTLLASTAPSINELLVHIHCHQKSLSDINTCIKALELIPGADVKLIPSGCCGMAGMFGYEEKHYALSMQIGELVLFPAIRAAHTNTRIVATGTSCRAQIHDALSVNALHPAQVMAECINKRAKMP